MSKNSRKQRASKKPNVTAISNNVKQNDCNNKILENLKNEITQLKSQIFLFLGAFSIIISTTFVAAQLIWPNLNISNADKYAKIQIFITGPLIMYFAFVCIPLLIAFKEYTLSNMSVFIKLYQNISDRIMYPNYIDHLKKRYKNFIINPSETEKKDMYLYLIWRYNKKIKLLQGLFIASLILFFLMVIYVAAVSMYAGEFQRWIYG